MILHRDERCVVVDKPAGVATHRGWDDSDDALLQRVRDAVDRYVYPVHRLDRGASGIVLFALDKEAAAAFSAACLSWLADYRFAALRHTWLGKVGAPGNGRLLQQVQQRLPQAEALSELARSLCEQFRELPESAPERFDYHLPSNLEVRFVR